MDPTATESGSHVTSRFIESRSVWVAICGREEQDGFRVWINSESTFGDIKAELVSMDSVNLAHASILHAQYGPRPYWTHLDPNCRPGDTNQTHYAVANGESQHYILAVVRTAQSDYPIAIFNLDSNPLLTVADAIVTAQPVLENRILTVTEYPGGDLDIRMQPLEFDRRVTNARVSESFPSVFFVTTIEASGVLSVPSGSIPPLLQTPLIHCEHLLRRVTNVPIFQAQATHVLRAILHIISNFSDALKPIFEKSTSGIEAAFMSESSLAELLPVAPQLARQLANILDRMERVIRASKEKETDPEKIQSGINQAFVELCGDFPGAVAVRQSYATFSALGPLDTGGPDRIKRSIPASETPIPTREALYAREQMVETVRTQLGDENLDTARAMFNLASEFTVAGRYSKAENFQDKAVKILRTRLGETHLDSLAGILGLSVIYSAQGRYKKAAPLQNQVLQGRKQQLGATHVDVHRAMLLLGTTYFRQGRYSEAKQLQSVAVDGLRAALGVMHEDTLRAMGDLSLTYAVLGLYSEAEKLQTMAVRGLVNTLGGPHISTYRAELNLATTHYRYGRYSEAVALQEKASDALEVKLGKTHPDTLLAKRDLSLTYSTVGKYDKAEELQRVLVEGLRNKLGGSHPDTRIAELYLATTYYGQERYPDAGLIQANVLEKLKLELGGEHVAIFTAMRDLALTRCAEGEHKEAIELQELVLAGLERMLGAGHPDTIIARRDLGATHKAKGNLDKAMSYQHTALQGLNTHLGKTHPEALITMLNLVIIYKALDHPLDAQKLQQEALASLEPAGLHHAGVLSALYNLALSYKTPREARRTKKQGRLQKGALPTKPPAYSLAELLEMLNATDAKPDSDMDMDDGDRSLDDGDDGLDMDMDKDIH